MPLAGYQPEQRVVPIDASNSFRVRGLGLNDIAVLIREHFPDLHTLFDLFGTVGDIEPEKLQPLIISMVSQAPGFAANVIALAAGEGDASDAERLPIPVQIQALVDIGQLTFSDVGGIKKAVETVAALLTKTPEIKQAMQTMSPKTR
jgi:hypothetical protein